MDKNNYFAIGGIGAFGLYAFFVFLVAISLMDFNKKRTESIRSEQSAIEVSIEDKAQETQKTPTQQTPQTQNVIENKQQEEPKPKQDVEALEPTKILKTVVKQELKQSTQTPKQLQKQTQTQPQKQTPTSAASLLSGMSIRENQTSRSGVENEYLLKIKKIILQNWNWQQSDHGKGATIELNIKIDGSFTFRLLDTNNKEFSNRAIECLKALQKTGFPPPPDSKAIMGEPLNFKGYQNSL